MNGYEGVLGLAAGIVIFVLAIVIVIYVVESLLLNKFNKLIYGQGTALAWIPIANTWLLGKLVFNKLGGWILIGLALVSGAVNNEAISSLLSLVNVVVIVFAFIKYSKIKNGILNVADVAAKCDTYDFPPDMEFLTGKASSAPQQPQQPQQTISGKVCPNCGVPIADGTEFCPSCGQKIQ